MKDYTYFLKILNIDSGIVKIDVSIFVICNYLSGSFTSKNSREPSEF